MVIAKTSQDTELEDEISISLQHVTISFGNYQAVKNVFCDIPKGKVTSLIGPSGCCKSTVLRALNRMNDLICGCSMKGRVLFEGLDENIYYSKKSSEISAELKETLDSIPENFAFLMVGQWSAGAFGEDRKDS